MRSVCLDCGPCKAPTAGTIDQIARLHLAALRSGCELELRNAGPSLLELIGFVGLGEVLRIESRRESGNSLAVSRKKVNSPIRPPFSSSTWRAHGSWPPCGLGLYCP